jgi:hypothetical protein
MRHVAAALDGLSRLRHLDLGYSPTLRPALVGADLAIHWLDEGLGSASAFARRPIRRLGPRRAEGGNRYSEAEIRSVVCPGPMTSRTQTRALARASS